MMTRTSRPVSRLFQRTAIAAALALSFVTSAQALTLSRPLVQSKQGEALQAEIDITQISISEQQELEASLASADVYRAARVEVPSSNGNPIDIQVQLLRRENGRLFLKISSKQAIQSNALDLLIDMKWATGRLLRDISVSLDDGRKSDKPVAAPIQLGKQLNVQRGDTASALVAPATPEGVSLDQMLLALVRQNPDAFVDNNVNRMKAGALVTLPTAEQARAVSREDARNEIRVQAKDFDAYRAELAARAPGGKVAEAGRDAAGKLQAKIENKNLKTGQDKLTLTKPNKGEAEDKIAKQREAQEVASRAAEISRNIAELGKIAAATTASEAASGPALNAEVPASAVDDDKAWLDELMQDPNTPVGAAVLVAALILIAMWRRRSANTDSSSEIEGLPPLNVKFDLDLPSHDESNTDSRGHTEEVMTHASALHEHPHDHEQVPHHAEPALDEAVVHQNDFAEPVRPTLEMPNISLDLEEDPINDHPYQVRMDLADELWKLGQLHTSRALMEEVANEASGAVKEKALQWLAERG
jgi:FimV-like protein